MTTLLAWATVLMQGSMLHDIGQHHQQIAVRERAYTDLERLPTHGISSSYPSWFAPDVLLVHQDIEHRIDLLPYDEDKDEERYVVAPLQGAIVPIVTVQGADRDAMIFGGEVDVMSYLEDGALHHAGTIAPWEGSGNYVLAGHTSYQSYRGGRYKTVMQFLALMQTGDPLWLYDKQSDGTWARYDFSIEDSFQTIPENVGILKQPDHGNQFTIYGCYPFGTLDKRWVVQGQMLDA